MTVSDGVTKEVTLNMETNKQKVVLFKHTNFGFPDVLQALVITL